MHRHASVMLLLVVLTVLVLAVRVEAQVQDWLVKQIEEATPAKATAKPAKPRKVLVFTLCRGFAHDSIPIATKALQTMAAKTGAFEVVVSDDIRMFEPDKLKAFDTVIMNNTTGRALLRPTDMGAKQAAEYEKKLQKSLLDFVMSGKGLVGIHAATDCYYDWPEYGELMGGYFAGHPWNEKVAVKLDDPKHPVNKAFGGKGFEVVDEIYQFKDAYSRDKLHVLLSLDPKGTDMNKDRMARKDGDYAISWVRRYGAGRVFYCSLGHNYGVFTMSAILKHYLDGIQFAIGDLPADTTPSDYAGGDWKVVFDGKNLDENWTYKPGGWELDGDAVKCNPNGGYLWTKRQYGDFVLELEFKTSATGNGNSGVFIRTGDKDDSVQTGIEMQVLNSWGKEVPGMGDCGALYDLKAPAVNMALPAGQWNKAMIVCQGPRIAVHLNGRKIVDIDVNDWAKAGKNPDGRNNKYAKALKDFPRAGYIGMQDHGNPVWYRNVRIKPLTPAAEKAGK